MATNTAATQDFREGADLSGTRHKQMGQLAHDLKNHLGVICMGIDVVQSASDDVEREEVCEMIREDGIEPIRALIAQISELAAGDGRP
jgi:hypothetical protein